MTLKDYKGAAVATTLFGPLTAAATSFSVGLATGFPTGATPFVVAIRRGTTSEEKILCTRSGTVFTAVNRGYDDTVATDHPAGAAVEHVLDAASLAEASAHSNTTTRDDHTQYLNAARHTLVSHDTLGLATQGELDAHNTGSGVHTGTLARVNDLGIFCAVATGVAATDTANLQAFLNAVAASAGRTGWIPPLPSGVAAYVTNADLLLDGATNATIHVAGGTFIAPGAGVLTGLKIRNCFNVIFPESLNFSWATGFAGTRMLWVTEATRTKVPALYVAVSANVAAPTATTLNGSPGALPQATIALASTAGLAAATSTNPQRVTVVIPNGLTTVTYTGISGNNLTGCSGGSGTPASGAAVTQLVVGVDLDTSAHYTRLPYLSVRKTGANTGRVPFGARIGSGGNVAGANAISIGEAEFNDCTVGILWDGTATSWAENIHFENTPTGHQVTEQAAYPNSNIQASAGRVDTLVTTLVDIQQVTQPAAAHNFFANGPVNNAFFNNPNGINCSLDCFGKVLVFGPASAAPLVLIAAAAYPNSNVASQVDQMIYNSTNGHNMKVGSSFTFTINGSEHAKLTKGLAQWGAAAVTARPAAPVTLADVIAVLQLYGMTA